MTVCKGGMNRRVIQLFVTDISPKGGRKEGRKKMKAKDLGLRGEDTPVARRGNACASLARGTVYSLAG